MPSPSNPTSILIVDDDPQIRIFAQRVLEDEGYQVSLYDPLAPDSGLLEKSHDLAILDIMMPVKDGFALQQEIARHSAATQFIFMTGEPDREKLNRALDRGVFLFLTKPFTPDHIRYAVLAALRLRFLWQKNRELDLAANTESLGLVGRWAVMAAVREKILQLASLEIPVLVTGESGTGKEITAQALHHFSHRAAQPFIPVNCAGLPPSLIESELFGHTQGAFTGAVKTKHGYFEAADGGTLFLDEIGDLSMEMQSRLLRVLDKGEFNRVGDPEPRRVDVRIISATNRGLETMVREQKFREDLFYRLRGSQIRLPPLRDRREDIPLLVRHFLGDETFLVVPAAMDLLQGFPWPGNVRELSMAVKNLKALASCKTVSPALVENILGIQEGGGESLTPVLPYQEFKQQVLSSAEKVYFESLLQAAGGNASRAAARAGMHRKNFYEKIKQLGI